MNIAKGTRVEHDVFGTGTAVRMTRKPERVWVRWDATGLTTPVGPDYVVIRSALRVGEQLLKDYGSEGLTAYLAAVESASARFSKAFAEYATVTCQECGVSTSQVLQFDASQHATLDGKIVVCCEGGRLIEPEAVGIPNGAWQDWRPFCPCGCAQRVPSEETYASDECELSPEGWQPSDLDGSAYPPLSGGWTGSRAATVWDYLDGLRA